jgi:sugar lactone lactonase YvrE
VPQNLNLVLRRAGFSLAGWIISSVLAALAIAAMPGGLSDPTADRVLGQTDFNHSSANPPALGTLVAPTGIAVDAAGHLYVADAGNNRVLGWEHASAASRGQPADLVIGQPDGVSNSCATSRSGLCLAPCSQNAADSAPAVVAGIAVDRAGNLYVADTCNHRVVGYFAPFRSGRRAGESARLVIGQRSFTGAACNGSDGEPSADGLCAPAGVAVDAAGRIYVADTSNSRVLEYDPAPDFPDLAGDLTANRVFGQNGNFESAGCDHGTAAGDLDGVGPDSLCNPTAVAVDASGNLYIGDTGSSRVLEYRTPIKTTGGAGSDDAIADVVFGQAGNFTAHACNQGLTPDAGTLCNPTALAFDSAGALEIADSGNSRVLEYAIAGQSSSIWSPANASAVYGQAASFDSGSCNHGATGAPLATANSLCGPEGIAADHAGNLYVADTLNNRVLRFGRRPVAAAGAKPADAAAIPTPTPILTPSPQPTPDITPPTISITAPASTIYTLNQVVIASYTCTDPYAAIATCTGTVPNGSPIDTTTLGLADFTVKATDVLNNPASQTVAYEVAGFAPPTITITSPTATIYPLDSTVLANYSCADQAATVVTCAGPVASGAPIDTSALGPAAFTVTAVDSNGETASRTVTYEVAGFAPPTVTITSPTDTLYELNSTVLANYSCADQAASVVTCAGPVASGAPIDTSALGPASFTVTAVDSNGNTASQSVTYVVTSFLMPTITINSPTAGPYGLRQVVTADYTCTSPGAPMATCTGTVTDGSPIDTSSTGSKEFVVTAVASPDDTATETVVYTVVPISPTSLSFAPQLLGTTSARKTVTVTNATTKRQRVSFVSAIGDFKQSSQCRGRALAPGASCTIRVAFAPKAAGTQTGVLTVVEGGTTMSVSLGGVGAQVKLSPATLSFQQAVIGSTSAVQKLTLTNNQPAALDISGITTSGDFAETDSCGTSLAAHSSCKLDVTFAPTAIGKRSGTLTVNADAPIVNQTVALQGLGLPLVSVSPGSLAFGRRKAGTTSPAEDLTAISNGGAKLAVTQAVVEGENPTDFTVGGTSCRKSRCQVAIRFNPTAAGERTATLAITDNLDPGNPQTVTLSGTGF